jgi:hypothetical protein
MNLAMDKLETLREMMESEKLASPLDFERLYVFCF